MTVKINGTEETIDDGLSISGLLKKKDVDMPDMVSVELNGEIIDRKLFDSTVVKQGDDIEFLYIMGGGQK